MMSVSVIVILTIAAYFLVLLGVGRLAARGGDNSSFFTGGRKTPWPFVAIAMVGAAISGVTFISVPGMVVGKGYAYLQMVLGFVVGYAVIAWVLLPLFYRRGLVSIYGYLSDRFGRRSHLSGAWIFIVSKMLGAAVRFFVVCVVVQLLVFAPLGLPFELNVAVTLALVWAYTAAGGVKTLIWTDIIKSLCLVGSVALCIYYVSSQLGIGFGDLPGVVSSHSTSKVFYFDNPMEGTYFWKQFVAGIFMAIATNGLDQDMMQRHMACADFKASRKNMMVSAIMQVPVILLFLVLGTLLTIYCEQTSLNAPAKSDELFGAVVFSDAMPVAVGVIFVLGLVSSAYSAAGSALTSLTTSMTVDILHAPERMSQTRLTFVRRMVHLAMTVTMAVVIIVFYHLSDDDAISAVYTLASYTYGPILGLFVFGLSSKMRVNDRLVPAVCIAAPCLAWLTTRGLAAVGYETGFELLLINAAYTCIGLFISAAFVPEKEKPASLSAPELQ